MEEVYTILAYLTAGVSLSTGTISFFIGLRKEDKTELIFGIMGLCLFVYLLLPPGGFILSDPAPYSDDIIFKRIFNSAYYGLFPWFIWFYTGKRNALFPSLISLTEITCYGIMFFTTIDRPKPIWTMVALLVYVATTVYGLIASIAQYRRGEKVKAKWFMMAIAIYVVLVVLAAINRQTESFIGEQIRLKFFLIHFHAIPFMLIMGVRVVADVFEKYQLEKLVKERDKRWQSFMHHAPVFVLEVDNQANITYINDFALKQLGYGDSSELLSKNCFEMVSLPSNVKSAKMLFDKAMRDEKMIPYLQNKIRTKQGQEITIDWINYLINSDDGRVVGVMSVGRDVTAGLTAQRMIDQLKLELEKENVVHDIIMGSTEIIGSSKAIGYAIQKANQVAATSAPVLLEGETGVGKELFADLIHKLSSKNSLPMVKVNCAALPKELIEDELFGHEKGAFTTANQTRKGRFELADGGTIFLDEIGELPLEMQPKLLRVLQNGEFEKLGGQKTIKVNVRVIAATNRDLAHEVSQNRFRDDLFYRLNVFPITIPAIRQRKEDLPELINYFIDQDSKTYNKSLQQISKADLKRLMEYAWPGNVRELKNVIERSVIASSGSTLKLDWFLGGEKSSEQQSSETLEDIERIHIVKILEECHWKINGENGAAEKLNMHPNTLRSKMKKLGINRPLEIF
jgi:PAS domain S-box-containing protein